MKFLSPTRRFASIIVDHGILLLILSFVLLPIKAYFTFNNFSLKQFELFGVSDPSTYIAILVFTIYLYKDFFAGRSIGKRVTKLQVVDYETQQIATPLQCLIRNIFVIIGPVELIVSMINQHRRIGDRVAGTEVTFLDQSAIRPKQPFIKILLPFAGTFFTLFLLSMWFTQSQKIHYVETSYNETESANLSKLSTDSLSKYLVKTDARVYDSIENKSLKYITVIYYLKENYINYPKEEDAIIRLTNLYIYHLFPKYSFKGEAKYVFRSESSFGYEETYIGL